MTRKIYIPLNRNDKPKMHLKFDCAALKKKGEPIPKEYITEEEAIAKGVKDYCLRCFKTRSAKGKPAKSLI